MESYENVFDEEWMNLGSMFFCDQDSNNFNHGLFSTEHDHGLNLETPILNLPSANESISSGSCVIDDQILAYTSDHDIRSDFYNHFSQESSNLLSLAQVFSDDVMEETQQDEVVEKGKMENSVRQPMHVADLSKVTHLKRKYETPDKKKRVSNDNNKNKKNSPPKKIQKTMNSINRNDDDSEETHENKEKITNKYNGRGDVQSSSSCSSEEDIVTKKTRAGRGAATDPQSIYARKRRERINERLRILQNLVPNGTKVDISTMLEEAVHYVKFLQLQINLLSSDDKWMYAPIAYNGVDMGLYNNISPTL
ncbi:hypothetical protein L1987_66419 [Smallanthus sonchifolius]|uniref:Uncharacterized protein n=1 Tax=Smallanthus sonchifolius TaxID=185202 RepID=A0ACB9BX24_9ASTR|nr:hypothetical protein L1987_66419 [Smallanthus sonchifolius]